MDFISSSSISSPIFTQFSPLSLSPGLVSLKPRYRVKTRRLGYRETKKCRRIVPIRGCFGNFVNSNQSESPRLCRQGNELVPSSRTRENVLQFVSKPLVYFLFCIAIGFSPVNKFQAPALALPSVGDVLWKKKKKKEVVIEKELVLKSVDHEFSDYTRRLLETVSVLLKSVEKVRKVNGDVAEVETALDAVKLEKEKLQREIMDGLYSDLKRMRKEKDVLMRRGDGIVEEALRLKRESERMLSKGAKEKVEKLEERVEIVEGEYNKIWERIDEIDDFVVKRETTTLSYGVRELISIERECVELVKSFNREMKQKNIER